MSAQNTGHSALPWAMETFGLELDEYGNVLRGEGRIISGGKHADTIVCEMAGGIPLFEHEANAAYIVRACNSHERLVGALQAAQAALVALSTPDEPGDMPDALLEQIADALAQAEGDA